MFGEYDESDYDINVKYGVSETEKDKDGNPIFMGYVPIVVVPLFFIAATTILPLLLLNLVIAIMSDTYERVITTTD